MSDEVNVTVSDETPIQASIVEVEPFAVTVADETPIVVTPSPVESVAVTIAEDVAIAVELTVYNGNILKFTSELLAPNGSATSFLLAHTFLAGSLAIYRNGVLATDTYTEKAEKTGVDFTDAPPADDAIEARYAYV